MKPLMTHAEIGRHLGLDNKQVWYIEKKALAKLRKILTRRLGPDCFDQLFKN